MIQRKTFVATFCVRTDTRGSRRMPPSSYWAVKLSRLHA
jgi:hypothetical protein